MALNDTLDQVDLTEILRAFETQKQQNIYTYILSAMECFLG